MKKLFKYIYILFIFLAIPAIILILITSHFSILGGLRSFDVLTGSMEPNVHVGSIIFTKPAQIYNVGDIIAFKRGDITVTHRIFGVKNGQFVTKGDANNSPDPQLVSLSQIIGKNFYTIPYFGRLISFVKSVPGFILFIVLPILIFIGFEINTIKEEYKKEIRKKILKEFNLAEKS